ncbi:hypothetical protein FSP39_006779 [Pinctada imbricata]|uniref:Cytochrome P450 n=1 Tax=Pinctada imbricata TaxID=66713 RepID=A0AA88YT00_PINIB|nr:hypothetical protein FSP39_006779 [Pinctada imbricata]
MIVELTIVGAALGVFVMVAMAVTSRQKKKAPPGPRGLPFFGKVFALDPNTIHLDFTEWKANYGDIVMTKMSGKNVLVLNSLEAIRAAFEKEDCAPYMSDRPLNFIGEKIMYGYKEVLLRRYDDEFKKLKPLMMRGLDKHGFQSAHFRKLMKEEIDHVTSKFSATNGKSADPVEILMPSFCNIIGMIFTGERVEDNHHFLKTLSNFEHYGDKMIQPQVHGVYKLFPWIRHCPCYHGQLYCKVTEIREQLYDYLVNDVKRYDANNVNCFIHEMTKEQEAGSGSEEFHLTDEHIVAMVMDLINTSVLTTKALISGFIFLMLHFPEVQAKLQKEIDSVIGEKRSPELEDMTSMPYMRACIQEVLRFQSHLPLTAPHANLTTEVDLEGYHIPQNTIIFANIFAVHHDDQLWDDPWSFCPERFLDDDGQFVSSDHPSRKNMIPFGIGRRVCVGKEMTYLRAFTYMTNLLQNFSFKMADGDELPSSDPRKLQGQNPVILPQPYKCMVTKRAS